MTIIIASTRVPKVNGVKRAVERLSSHFGTDFSKIQFIERDVKSEVSDTPKSIEELMRGAHHRALSAYRDIPNELAVSIGVEGGLFKNNDKAFLQSWSCMYDGKVIHYGSSGAVEIPQALSDEVFDRGIDLGIAIDGFAQQADVRSKQGTFGVLTNDIITREDSFELSTFFALVPYFNSQVYRNTFNK